ncbi:hypothetical protein ACGFU4_35815 [Streptomyces sp. NPDC048511]|uniref:hypothetical protein n=1 Tax=Streptomyces sp. NPDC048511 TaxID=3365562 RepID=UPI00371BA6B2
MTDTPMTPGREQEIRTLDLLELMSDRSAPVISGHLAVLLAEVDRLRGDVDELRHIHVNTLPRLLHEIQHHKDGKARWRARAETAEARVAELEAQRDAVLALHRKHSDSDHCFADDETWPCQTRTALGAP